MYFFLFNIEHFQRMYCILSKVDTYSSITLDCVFKTFEHTWIILKIIHALCFCYLLCLSSPWCMHIFIPLNILYLAWKYYVLFYILYIKRTILYFIQCIIFMSHSIYYSHRRIREARCAHSLSGPFVFLLFLQFCSGSQNERRGAGGQTEDSWQIQQQN